ncbi:MAG: sigma-E processing peptidase SpoIIGA [Oscillospiraceae bacterium]|nr:sigma-E processing peptidase SpoIIGA [Oscillospiraceae bacterium]
MTVIYVDTVLVLNSILDYLLLLSTAKLTAQPFSRLRLLAGSLLGGGYAVLLFLPDAHWLSNPLIKLLWAVLIVLVAFGLGGDLLRLTLVFLALSCSLAGILVLVSLFSAANLTYPQGIPVTSMDWKALILAASLCYLLSATFLRRIADRRETRLLPVKLRWDCRQTAFTALEDTGDLLTDPAGNGPVLVVYWKTAAAVLPQLPRLQESDIRDPVEGIGRLADSWGRGRLNLLPYRGIGSGQRFLLAVRVDSAVINGEVLHGQLVALAPDQLSEGSYQAVIGPRKGV